MTAPLACPDCQTLLPIERQETPWCECGWSSAPDEQIQANYPKLTHRSIERDRRHAHWLAEMDRRAIRLLASPWGRWLWPIYLIITVVLCLPVLLIQVIFWAGIGALLIAILFKSWLGFLILCLVIGGVIALNRWAAIPPLTGIVLTSPTAPQLFSLLDEVTTQANAPTILYVRVFLNAAIGIRQRFVWRNGPRFEPELTLGLFSLNALSQTQLRAVLAHEVAHLKHKDTLFVLLIANALQHLQDWTITTHQMAGRAFHTPFFGFVAGIGLWLLHFGLRFYLFGLVWLSRWAMRRQEYLADRAAAQRYGTPATSLSLINLSVIMIKLQDYWPIMVQTFHNNLDRHDFYYQFVTFWDKLSERTRQAAFARAVASFRSQFDTHPSYQDRRRALTQLDTQPCSDDRATATDLLPNRYELGRELTIQLLKRNRSR